jgi:dTDP-4-dehydrorhamnose 3,5-epimerase
MTAVKFTETSIKGAFLVDTNPVHDQRGFFARSWSAAEFSAMGLPCKIAAVNYSHTARRGIIRGMHYQTRPHQEAKFIRCLSGAFYDVIIDLRPGSPTFLSWAGFEIRSTAHTAILVPAGCAHGMQCLEDGTGMLYLNSSAYVPASERGIRWDDPLFKIDWPLKGHADLSDKDRSWPDFNPHEILKSA